jgi:hypothetical protein
MKISIKFEVGLLENSIGQGRLPACRQAGLSWFPYRSGEAPHLPYDAKKYFTGD